MQQVRREKMMGKRKGRKAKEKKREGKDGRVSGV